MTEQDSVASALYYVSPEDRDTWVTMAMAVKNGLGENGRDLWWQWSEQSEKFKATDAAAVWRSIRSDGGVTVRTLFAEARANGWSDVSVPPMLITSRPKEEAAPDRTAARERAHTYLTSTQLGPHPYLAAKGFPDFVGNIYKDQLVIPMFSDVLESIQFIAADGTKKFMPGGRAGGCSFEMGGTGRQRWLVEGYATGLSVLMALQSLYRDDQVVVCFSAWNLNKIQGHYVIADNDESGTGEEVALRTKLPYWMPPETGDANDYHQKHGLKALAGELRKLLAK